MPSNFTFVTNQNTDSQGRRTRSRRACDRCRNKKRRCHHYSQSMSQLASSRNLGWMDSQSVCQSGNFATAGTQWTGHEEQPRTPTSQPVHAQQEETNCSNDPQREAEQSSQPGSEEKQPHQTLEPDPFAGPPTPRFVGDLNPEARLLDETTSPEDAQEMTPGEVGIWVQPRGYNGRVINGNPYSPAAAHTLPNTGRGRHRPPVSDLLAGDTVQALSRLYFLNIHPIIPLLSEPDYWQSWSQGGIPMALVHVVCLLAAKSNDARAHLKLLQSGDTLVPVRPFCSQLYVSITAGLARPTTMKKATVMRILGLLSLHQEVSEGVEQASSCIAQAMHHAQSLAMHLPRPTDINHDLKRTFWCLWTLDRLNAATNSRPCIMADIDIAIPSLTPEESDSVAFDVWFRIAQMLNKVIGLYRPQTEDSISGWDSGYPGFEQILGEMNAWDLSPSTIATLHLFYLATAILAHRLKTIYTLPSPTPARLRQQLSAIQVIRYMKDPVRVDALHPFPIMVYATSLAISVSYQQLRYSRLSSDQDDARRDFRAGCEILQELRRTWTSADAMASLASRISGALDQLPCLDLLRLSRPNRIEKDGRHAGRQGSGGRVEGTEHCPSPQLTPADSQTDPQRAFPCLETMDLFADMDDVSWMYLDAENPVCFDSFPLMDFHTSYDTW